MTKSYQHTHYIQLTNRNITNQIGCFLFSGPQFCRIIKNLTMALIVYDYHAFPSGTYCLEIWLIYATPDTFSCVFHNNDVTILITDI